MELYTGRPEDTQGRLDKEIRVYDLLDSLGIEYERTDHERTDTMEACNEIDAILQVTICKNLFLCNQINSARLSFASPEDMERLLDITPGSVSIMGLMNDKENAVQLLVDEDVLQGEYLGCHPCINTSSLKMRTKDVFERFLPAVHHDMITVHLTGE